MSAWRKPKLLCLCLGLAVVGPALTRGAGARAVVGNTVHGVEDDGEFYDYYAPNGNATSMLNGGDITHGRWSIQNGNMCVSFPDDSPACYRVEFNGGSLDMTDMSTGSTFHNNLLRGNPQHL